MVAGGLIVAYYDISNHYGIIDILALSFIVILPLIFNMKHIKICEFVKGSAYLIYLASKYINILSIYAISNIYDVSGDLNHAQQTGSLS